MSAHSKLAVSAIHYLKIDSCFYSVYRRIAGKLHELKNIKRLHDLLLVPNLSYSCRSPMLKVPLPACSVMITVKLVAPKKAISWNFLVDRGLP